MTSHTFEAVASAELPSEWAKQLGTQSDDRFSVTLQSEEDRQVQVQMIRKVMDQLAEEAERNGMTPEDLEEILGEDVRPVL
ncbi:MAG: hypothetical protein HQL52_08170 [Magnetococcales bacterium]|nr:hypothetical protein [Magnetococcales bacterium]